MENPDYLRVLAERVESFLRAFRHLLTLSTFTSLELRAQNPGLPAVIPKSITPNAGPDDHWIAARNSVSRAAGRISEVTRVTDVAVTLRDGTKVDPFTAWITVTQFHPQLMPDDVIDACELALGKLEGMTDRAEARRPTSTLDLSALNPRVWHAARELWLNGHRRQAVEAAYGAVLDDVRSRTGRDDLSDDDVFGQAFSSDPPRPGRARLRWPGEANDRTVISMNSGIRQFSAGVQLAIRNPLVHGRPDISVGEAGERLAALSLLATWIDDCEPVIVQ
ncbi:TIGR02391 family protein [Mycobacterium marinum]|uniref:TIGR02391 family protein n=1 Tax=Mycobacterium marinum TaxID=1781 RepID=UPI0023594492|nr:TIGR02391 family protein [Mycobacterium marinum]MDC8974667.1 TIGR02391 family protein [Mycobacterium marinum]